MAPDLRLARSRPEELRGRSTGWTSAGFASWAEHYAGGPVGLGTIAVAVGEEEETLEEMHEPFLIQEGYLQRTPQGRVLTTKGYSTTGLQPLGGQQGALR